VLAGVGYGTRMAIDLARRAEAAGAAGILVLPHYLMVAEEAGIIEHMKAICQSVGLGVIYYARDNTRLSPAGLEKLAEACPNFIGYKDGIGDLQLMQRIHYRLGDRLVHIGGLPTAEVFAQPYLEMGVTTYSSAVFNFVPELALRFYKAVRQRDAQTVDGLMKSFYLPLIELRDKKRGYAVSMIKAGADLVGRPAGKVRPPLTELDAGDRETLRALIAAHA
jgi:5-dehydro-4-deoxyglucarate dehydratase